jgi:hypothetical protein
MSIASLSYIAELMKSLSIPYAFMEWKSKPPDNYYFVGEYNEVPSLTREENGYCETTFVFRGFTRGDWMMLEQAREKIEQNAGYTDILPNGTGIAVFYDTSYVVPTGDAELKSIKINLQIQEWKVN